MPEGLLSDHVIDRHLSGCLSYLRSVSLSELLLLTMPEFHGPLLRVDSWFGLGWLQKVFSRPASASVSLHRLVLVGEDRGPYVEVFLYASTCGFASLEVVTDCKGLHGYCGGCMRGHLVHLGSLTEIACKALLRLYDA